MEEEEKAKEIKIETGPPVENEGPPPENPEEPAAPKASKREKVKKFMKGVLLILRQFSHDYATRIFLFVMMIAALLLENAIGFAYAVVTIILLVTERKNNWTHGWISYTSISFAVFGAQIYFIATRDSLSKNGADIANWFGFGLTGGKAASVFVINFFIFLASILIGLFMYLKSNVLTDLEYKEVQRIYGPVLNKTLEVAENHEFQGRYSEYSEYHNNVSPKQMEILKKDFGSIKLQFYYKKFNRFLERLYHKHGYELSLFFLVILAFYNLSMLSIVFVVVAIYFSLPIKCFYNTEPNNKKLKHLKIKWRVFYVLMALDILRQYFFRIWFPLSWDINKMLIDEQFNCDPDGVNTRSSLAQFSKMDDYRVCVDSWRGWFTLDVTSTGRLFLYFFTLFLMVCFDKYFVPYKLSRYRYEEGDELDFTNPNNRGIMDHIRFFYYCHFYIIPMLLFIGVGLKLNITGQSDLIGAIYFFVGLAVLYSYKRLLRTKNLVWRSIETLNSVVLLLVVIFQMPLIDCPIALENRHFISLNECIILRTQYNSENDNTLNKINSSNAWYAIIDIIGINKVALVSLGTTYKELLMIIFFLFAIVQRKIWQHPYTKAYVAPYYEKKDRLNYQIAAKYVERVHVKRVITHRAILLDKEATIHYEKKIENKIKEWEDMFEKFDVDMRDNEEREPIRERGQIDLMSSDRTDLCYRIVDQVVAEIPDAHILGASSFMALIRKCNYDVEAVKSEVPYEIKRARASVVKDLRKIPQINLPPPKALRESILASLRFSAAPPGEGVAAAQREEEEGLEGGLRIQRTPEGEHDVLVDEEHKEGAEEKQPLENLRLSDVRSARSRGLALEEVLLEEPLEEGHEIPHVEDHDVSLSPMKSTRIHYGLDFDLYKDEPEKRTFVQKVKLWFIKHIKYTSLIGEIQARLLVGDSVFVLFLNLLLVNIDKITYFVFVLNHLSNANVLSLLLPVSIVIYAALEYPTAPSRYWKVMLYYTGLILMLKFLYQLPFFCGTPAFNFNNIFSTDDYSCDVYLNDPWTLTKRYDYIIGIVKFTGDSSYPVNRGLFRGLFWDVAAFMCLVLVRFAMDSAGVWNHVKIYNSFKYVPQLGEPFPNEYKQDPAETPVNAQNGSQVLTSIAEFPRPSVREEMKPIKATLLSFLRNMFTFNSQASGQAAIRKPGANYYKYMAPLSLVILLYFIFFYSQMVSSATSIADELNQSLFSGGVVIALLICILYMLLERVMFISRETIFKRVIENRAEGDEDDDDLKGEDVKKAILSRGFFTKIVSHYVLVALVNAFFFYAMIRSLSQETHGNYVYIYIGYILCSLYLFFSAEQIRYGYPLVVDTRFFHSTDDITVLLFKIYRAVPFLYEITSIMDWTASKTSLNLGQWMRVEDAYSNLFLVKNSMESKKNRSIGIGMGNFKFSNF